MAEKTYPLAIVALILAIIVLPLAVTVIGQILAIIPLILAFTARKKIDKDPNLGGKGIARTAEIISVIALLLRIILSFIGLGLLLPKIL